MVIVLFWQSCSPQRYWHTGERPKKKTGVMTFSEMECEDIDLAGAKSVPTEGFGEGR